MLLKLVKIHISKGEVIGIVGPYGAGKTTLFNTVGGANRPDAGTVTLDWVDITGLRPHKLAVQGMVHLSNQL